MTSRGIPLATALVVPTTRNPPRSNIDLVPTNAMVRSIGPGEATGRASTAGAPCETAKATAPSSSVPSHLADDDPNGPRRTR
jgi:hypothetical protein